MLAAGGATRIFPNTCLATCYAHRSAHAASTALYALRVHIQRVQPMTRRHEQAVPMPAAEADVRAALRQRDMADRLTLRREHADTVEFVGAHAPAAPQVAVDVDAKAVRRSLASIDQHAVVFERACVAAHIEHADLARHLARGYDVEQRLIRRKRESVRARDVVRDDRHLARLAIDAIDTRRQF